MTKIRAEDIVLFAKEEEKRNAADRLSTADHWEILIVDDEQEVHALTRMVLSNFEFDGRHLLFHSAYSEQEARQWLQAHPDVAVILLDVVMERDDSGLRLVKHIREELKYTATRIILRTGQPGQAPEKMIITSYDINDYKEKTELTSQKLFTSIMAALRAYRDIKVIENNKRGLETIIQSSADLFEWHSMNKFASGVLTQLSSILDLPRNALHCNSFAVTKEQEEIYILAASGDDEAASMEKIENVVPPRALASIKQAFQEKRGAFHDTHFTCYFESKTGQENVIYFEGTASLNEWQRYLIEIYSANVSAAFENLYLNEEVEQTQKEIIFTLGEIAESRSRETGYHVKRVAEYSRLLALGCGLTEEEADLVRLASTMHDVGKVAIPDAILNKPGKLTPEEFAIIQEHPVYGYAMLNHSKRAIIRSAATIAYEHHEKFNGTGYPRGLAGEDIHLYGRITAIADVFDALGSDRVYKKAWQLDDILAYFHEQRGKHFDPALVDIFFGNLTQFLQIRERYADHSSTG